ncbi:hypothetical protein ES703_103999 [subsurface metagenome]|jgi:hypothetical protein
MKFRYAKEDFFGDDGWIKYDNFKVAVGQKGELEYCDPLKNASYYEQNPYYTVIFIDSEDIQDDIKQFEKTIKNKIKEDLK